MRILLVAFYFPPFGGGASTRVRNFARYLPSYGIHPCVLTASEHDYEPVYQDASLLAQLGPQVEIYRARVLLGQLVKKGKLGAMQHRQQGGNSTFGLKGLKRLVKSLLIPDEQALWLWHGLRQAKTAFTQHSIETVVASGPPFSGFLLGALIAKRFDIPLILDYRDLWNANPFYQSNRMISAVQRALETRILRTASKVVVTTANALNEMKASFPFVADKLVLIPNGYDSTALSTTPKIPSTALRVNHIGSLTRQRSPEFLLKAVRSLVQARPSLKLEIGFAGFVPEEHRQLVEDLGLADIVRFYGEISAQEATALMAQGSDILVLFQRQGEGGSTAIPGKLYEYLASGIPVLAIDEGGGATTELLREFGVESITDYGDVGAIRDRLAAMVDSYESIADHQKAIQGQVQRYERKNLTQELAHLLRVVTK